MKILTNENSVLNDFLSELRSAQIQKDSMRFRRNLERAGEILAYEISKTLSFSSKEVNTPLGVTKAMALASQPVLAVVLRAGIPLYQGFLNYFDKAESAFVAAYRGKPDLDHNFDISMDYLSTPDLSQKTLILIDPMLATGKSLYKTYEALLGSGKPERIIIASVIASKEGVAYVSSVIPEAELWSVAVDETLNEKFYIVPGLGDAGDLSFGAKL